jgi:hypothetical protein
VRSIAGTGAIVRKWANDQAHVRHPSVASSVAVGLWALVLRTIAGGGAIDRRSRKVLNSFLICIICSEDQQITQRICNSRSESIDDLRILLENLDTL